MIKIIFSLVLMVVLASLAFGMQLQHAYGDGLQTTINVPGGPDFFAVNPNTNTIYVANLNPTTVSVIDGSTNTVTKSIPVGLDPEVMAVNPVTNKIYVGNWNSHTVSVIDGSTNTVTNTIALGSIRGITVNPVTNKIYVINYDTKSVSVIDGITNNVTSTIPVGDLGYDIAVNPTTNKIYVTHNSNYISVIDGSTNTANYIQLGDISTTLTREITVNPTTNKIYIDGGPYNRVSVMDGSTNTITSITGIFGSTHIAVNPVTNKIYVANYNINTLYVLDGSTNTVTKSVDVGFIPVNVAVNPTTNKIYAGHRDNGIAVIDTSLDTIPPTIIPPPNQVVTANGTGGSNVSYPQATATDNVGVTSGPACIPTSGSLFPVGITTVTCTASDAVGNIGKATFTVTVNPPTSIQPSGQIALPSILKIVAKNWSQNTISDFDFLQSVQYLINQGTMIVPHNTLGYNSSSLSAIPQWVKNNAGLWVDGQIDDSTFASGIQYLFTSRYLPVSVNGIPSPISNVQNPISSITVSTDRSSYSSGNTIYFSGTNADSTNVTILVFDPTNKFILLTSGNAYSNHQFQIMVDTSTSDNQQRFSLAGTYSAIAFTTDRTKGSTTTFYFNPGVTSISSSTNEIDIATGAGGSANAACVATNDCFYPNPLTVAPGTTVTWKNTDNAMHVVCSGKPSDDECGKVFEEDSLKPGKTFQFTFADAGTYDYYCSVHPWMTGQVIVDNNVQQTTQSTIIATTDKSSYNAGDSIVVSGTVNPVNQLNPNQPVTIQTYNAYNELVRIDQVVPTSFGTYSVTIPAHGPLWQSVGTYTLKLQYNLSTPSTLTFAFNPVSSQTQQINITSGGALNVGFSTDPVNPSIGGQTQLKINFLNKQGSTQQHIDYKVSVTQGSSQILGTPITHTAEGSVSIPIQFSNGGNYNVIVEVDGVLFQPIPPQTATFSLSVSGIQNNVPPNSGTTEIDIATGAGGSANAACVATNDCFYPNPLTVAPGTTVTWKNTDNAMHVVCSGKSTDDECGKVFEEDSLKPGKTFQFTFADAGTYDYFCSVHPWMTGQVIVGGEQKYVPTSIPSKLTATIISPTQINLSWMAPTQTYGKIIAGYSIEQESNNGLYGFIGNTTGTTTTHSITGLTTGVEYGFRVSTIYSDGTLTDPSSSVSVIIPTSVLVPTPTDIKVSTSQSSYYTGDTVSATVVLSGANAGQNIAISFDDPTGNTIISRTVTTDNTGSAISQFKIPDYAKEGTYQVIVTSSVNSHNFNSSYQFSVHQKTPPVSIVSVQATDQQGNPVSSFSPGSNGYVKVLLYAKSNTPSLVTVNLFDSQLTVLGIGSIKTTLATGQSEIILSFTIPRDAIVGTANIYVDTFTDWPSIGGKPLTPESSSMVEIQ